MNTNQHMEYVVTISTGLINPLKLSGYFIYHDILTLGKSTFCPHNLFVLYGSQNKQRLFPYRASTGWFFVTETESVYCAVRTEYLYKRASQMNTLKINTQIYYII